MIDSNTNKVVYPYLAILAYEHPYCLASSVTYERLFPWAGRVVSETRVKIKLNITNVTKYH